MGKLTMKKHQGSTLAAMEGLTAAGFGCISFACIGAAEAGAKLSFPAGFALGLCAALLWRKKGGLRGYSSFKRLWAALFLERAAGLLALGLGFWPFTLLSGLASGGSVCLFFGAYRDIHRVFGALCRMVPEEKREYVRLALPWSLLAVGTLGLLWCSTEGFLRAAAFMSVFCAAGVSILLAESLCLSDQRGAEICRKYVDNY